MAVNSSGNEDTKDAADRQSDQNQTVDSVELSADDRSSEDGSSCDAAGQTVDSVEMPEVSQDKSAPEEEKPDFMGTVDSVELPEVASDAAAEDASSRTMDSVDITGDEPGPKPIGSQTEVLTDQTLELEAGFDAGSGTVEIADAAPNCTVDSVGDLAPGGPTGGEADYGATVDSAELDAQVQRKVTANWGDDVERGGPMQTIKGKEPPTRNQQSTLVVQSRNFRALGSDNAPQARSAADYDLLNTLGEGGMGVVYSARQASIDRTVAIKMLKSGTAKDERQRHKFLSEAVITGELDHPNIVPIYDLGTNHEGALFYSMKCVQGTPWDKRIREISLSENTEILMKVADAVAFAHARNVIHRDLKPENTMLGDFGEVLVMDWGLAMPTTGFKKSNNITPTFTMGGTPAYMAPEMALGPLERITAASDIYLLGAILYECITGAPPHRGKDVMACLRAASKNVITPTEEKGELLDIALKAMSTAPKDRYASVQQFQEAIRRYLAHSESILLTTRAEQQLASAQQAGDYQAYAQSVFAFQESLNLWSENEPARIGLQQAKLAYGQTACDKGDYDLAASLLDPDLSDHAALLEQIRAAQQEREARTRRLRRAKLVVVGLVALIFLVVSVGLLAVNHQRGVAIKERDNAKKAQLAAELAKAEEEKAREEAERAKDKEQLAKEEAIEAQEEERLAKEQALAAEFQERRARKAEEAAKADAQYQAYVALIGLAAAKIEENAFGAARDLLDQCEPDRRNWEWGRLAFLCQQAVRTMGTDAPIESIDLSPDGDLLAASGWNGMLNIWRLSSQQPPLAIPHGPTSFVNSVALAPAGRYVATGSSDAAGGYLRLWDSDTGQLVRKFEGHEDAVLSVTFSPDGQWLLSSSYDGTARMWDVESGELLQTFVGHDWWVWSAAFSPDAKRIVTASHDGTAMVWSTETGELLGAPFMGHWKDGSQTPVYVAVFSADGRYIASGGLDNRVLIWDPDAMQPFDYSRALADGTMSAQHSRALTGHKAAVRSIQFSPDGQRIITGSQDNTVNIWIAETGELVKTLRGHDGWVRSCRFSPDGQQVLSGSHDQTVKFWDIQGYQEARVLRGQVLDSHVDAVLSASFSDDGLRIATASRDRTAKVWNVLNGKEVRQFREGHEFTTAAAIFFPDGKRMLTTAVDSTTRVWDVATGSELVDLRLRGTGLHGAAAVSHGGQWILTGSERPPAGEAWGAKLWNANDGRLVRALKGHKTEVTAVAFSHDDRWLFTADRNGRGILWNRETGEEIVRIGDDAQINAAVFLPDGQTLLTANNYNAVRQWQIPSGAEITQRTLRHPESVVSLAVDRAGQLALSACADGQVRLWDISSGQLVRSLDVRGGEAAFAQNLRRAMKDFNWDEPQLAQRANVAEAIVSDLLAARVKASPAVVERLATALDIQPDDLWKTVFSVAISPDGTHGLTIAASDRVVRLWNLADGSEQRYPADANRLGPFLDLGGELLHGLVWAAEFSPLGDRVVTVGGDSARLWDLRKNIMPQRRELMTFSPHGAVASARFSPDRKYLATGSWDNSARIWDTETGQVVRRLGRELEGSQDEHQGNVNSVDFSPNGKIVLTASEDRTVKLWRVSDWTLLRTLRGHSDGVLHATFSHDGSRVLTASRDKTARIWDVETGQQLMELNGHKWAVQQAAFSADDQWVVTGGEDNLAIIWRLNDADATIIRRLEGHTAGVTAVAFSQEPGEPTRVLTGSEDYTTILWDARTGREVLTLKGHTQEVTSACFSPDGQYALTSSRDGTAIVWLTTGWSEQGTEFVPMTVDRSTESIHAQE